tara:strand:- start:446 stop:736 length:291 start_codon:yes stop_codon:yes gene_type:complete
MLSVLVLLHLRMRICNARHAFFMLYANAMAASWEPTEHLTVGHAAVGLLDRFFFVKNNPCRVSAQEARDATLLLQFTTLLQFTLPHNKCQLYFGFS